MILMDARMILLARLRNEPPPQPDDEMEASLRAALAELDPDPLFRRRLRGRVLNGYVEVREGMRPLPPSGRAGRIGRAALYASVTAALAASAVAAVSNDALPGDPVYGAKIVIEHVRTELAPAGVRLQLAEASLDERLSELEQLASRGDWERAVAAGQEIAADLDRLSSMAGAAAVSEQSRLEHQLTVLTAVFEEAPPAAREGMQHAIEAPAVAPGQPGLGTQAGHTPAVVPSPTVHPERTARPDHTPHPAPADH